MHVCSLLDGKMCARHRCLLKGILLLVKEVGSARLRESDFTPYQSNDPSPTIPTYRQKEEKGKNNKRQKGIEQLRPIRKALTQLLKPSSLTPLNTGSSKSF